jgi:AcrR family transcriptional regulator
MAGRPKKGDTNLDIERIVKAAWRLVDRDGLDALSTRSLAAELDVKGPALYWHVRSKQHLFSLMVEDALAGSIERVPPDLPWWEWLREVGLEQRRTFLAHRDSGRIVSGAPPGERLQTEIFTRAMEPLLDAGFSRSDAGASFGGIASLVLGTVIYEQDPATHEFLRSYHEPDRGFAFVLDAYVTGLRAKAPAAKAPTAKAAAGTAKAKPASRRRAPVPAA